MGRTFLLTVVLATVLATFVSESDAYGSFRSRIPNGDRVPNPCKEGTIWAGVGHQSALGANTRNPFGMDFKAAGNRWTVDLCRKDSDGDGLTNGQELGDPDCVWSVGATPARTTGLSHPGVCPFDSTRCRNAWTVCPKAFSCPALDEPGVIVKNITMKNTAVPPQETTYICQAFELNNTASPVHMIGSKPIIVNKDVMHHMIIYACDSRPEQALFDNPRRCFMSNNNCTQMLNLWGFGSDGECFSNSSGFRIGGEGYRYAILELHWNNPAKRADYTDGSGFSLYYTPKLRPYDQGTLMYGEVNLVLPPWQPLISVNHTCPSVCTNHYHDGTRYITGATIHMHSYGAKGRVSLWRNGALVKDLYPLQAYDYNSPQLVAFDPPVEYRKGDEVKTECYFNTAKNNFTVFYGESTSDEMCFSFLSYYPNNVSKSGREKLSDCISLSGINECWLFSNITTPQVENGCNITAMLSGEMPTQVQAEMYYSKCFSRTGCDPVCRDYLNNTLWPSNACYDPKRSRQMAEILALGAYAKNATVTNRISATLYGQRFCEEEINMLAKMNHQANLPLATPTPPMGKAPMPPAGGLTSEHLLIIIIVCSCFGFVLILAGLGLLANKLRASGPSGATGQPMVISEGAKAQNSYDNILSVEKEQF